MGLKEIYNSDNLDIVIRKKGHYYCIITRQEIERQSIPFWIVLYNFVEKGGWGYWDSDHPGDQQEWVIIDVEKLLRNMQAREHD